MIETTPKGGILAYRNTKGLYTPTVLPRHVKAQNGALRRPGETWQGKTGVWFYKRPDGKVIRIEPPNKPGTEHKEETSAPAKTPATPTSTRQVDDGPLKIAKSTGILAKVLRKLCAFERDKLNKLRAKQGLDSVTFKDLRLKVIHPEEVVLSREITEDMMPRIKEMAKRLQFYDPEYAGDYAPVILASDGKTVVDGNYRAAAYKLAGLDEMLVLVPRKKDSSKEEEE